GFGNTETEAGTNMSKQGDPPLAVMGLHDRAEVRKQQILRVAAKVIVEVTVRSLPAPVDDSRAVLGDERLDQFRGEQVLGLVRVIPLLLRERVGVREQLLAVLEAKLVGEVLLRVLAGLIVVDKYSDRKLGHRGAGDDCLSDDLCASSRRLDVNVGDQLG